MRVNISKSQLISFRRSLLTNIRKSLLTNIRKSLPILVISGLLIVGHSAQSASPTAVPSLAQPPATYPQIVRLSYVEGDVRISRGKVADKEHEKDGGQATGWEQATTNIPIESGYNLVTGKGRAEIEFEDASTVYVADNSVLAFSQITTTAGVPYTEIALLAGTATINVHNLAVGESFNLTTPTDSILLRYPRKAVWRITSYLDAVSITPLADVSAGQSGMTAAQANLIGKTTSYRHGQRMPTPAAADPATFAAWDKWVRERLEARDLTMSAAMKDAGLAEPVPGLADMNGKGTFFSCAPYGTCWQPTNGWEEHLAEVSEVGPRSATVAGTQSPQAAPSRQAAPTSAAKTPNAQKVHGQSAADAYLASHPGATFYTEDYTFPCSAYGVQDLVARDPATGQERVVDSAFLVSPFFAGYPYQVGYPYPVGYPIRFGYPHRVISPFWGFDGFNGLEPWDWTICHAGSWIRWHHRYVWVAGSKRHHHPPVRWVKTGRTVGYVPIHPRDEAGKTPINLKDGLFRVKGKSDAIERVNPDEREPLQLLNDSPKEFRNPALEPLKSAEAPRAEGHSIYAAGAAVVAAKGAADSKLPVARGTAIVGSTSLAVVAQGTPIMFDRKSQSFLVSRPVIEGGRPASVVEPLGGRGASYQAGNSGGFAGSSNSSRSSTPAQSYSGGSASRASSPTQSYNAGSSNSGSYSRPSAPSYSAPAPSYSAPSGGSSSGASPHK